LLFNWPRKMSANWLHPTVVIPKSELQGSIQVMTVIWALVGVVVLAGAGAATFFVRRRSRADALSRIVADIMGREWASRLGTDVESVRGAVLRGEPAELREQLATLIANVAVNFNIAAPSNVGVSVRCEYADRQAVTETSARISWDLVPAKVREQYLRTGENAARCHWLVADPEPAPS